MNKSWTPSFLLSYACTINEVVEVIVHDEDNEDEVEEMYKPQDIPNTSNDSTVMYISSSSGEDSSDYEPYIVTELGASIGQYLIEGEKREEREDKETNKRGEDLEVREEQYHSFSEVIGENFISRGESEQDDGDEARNLVAREVPSEVLADPVSREEIENEVARQVSNEVQADLESEEETEGKSNLAKAEAEESNDNKTNVEPADGTSSSNDWADNDIVKIRVFEQPLSSLTDGHDGSYVAGQRLYQQALERFERLAAIADRNKTPKRTSDPPKPQKNEMSRFVRLYNLSKDKQLQGRERRLRIERASAKQKSGTRVGKVSLRDAEKLYYRGIKQLVDIDNRTNEGQTLSCSRYRFREELKEKAQRSCSME